MNKEPERLPEAVMEALNKVANNLFGSSPNYRYYENKETKDRFFYTTEKVNHKGSPKYVAGIYRFRKTKDDWKLVKKVGFAKKRKAIDWAGKKSRESNNKIKNKIK